MIKKINLSILFFLIILGNLNSFAQNQGFRFIQLEQYSEAKQYFLKALQQETNVQDYVQLVDLYLKEGNLDSAKFILDQGLTKFANDANIYPSLVKYYVETNDINSIIPAITKAENLSRKKDQGIYIELAKAYFEYKNYNYDRALLFLEKAKEIDKTDSRLYLAYGKYFLKLNNNGEAANAFRRVNYYHPENPDGYYFYGKVYYKTGNYNEASSAFLKAIGLDSNYAPAWRDLSGLSAIYGYYTEAVKYYAKYISMITPRLAEHVKYSTILNFSKDYKNSLQEALIASSLDSTNFVMKRIISYNYYELKDYKPALKAINALFAIIPSEKIISTDYEYFGKILSKNGLDSLALINYFKALEMDSSVISLYENIGYSYEKTKNYKLATEYYQKLIENRNTRLGTDFYYLGRNSYFYVGVCNDSIEKIKYIALADTSFSVVIELNPTSSIGYFWKARVKSVLDPESENGTAKPYYEKAASIMETNSAKYKKDLIEAYQYLGYYYYIKQELDTSKTFWNKILVIDPLNEIANKALKGIK